MKILSCKEPGILEYQEVQAPIATPGFSVVKVKRIGICGTDIHAFAGTQPYFSYPRILGHELGCEYIEGDAVGFVRGEAVTLIPYYHCGKCIACRTGKPNCCEHIQVAGVHTDGGMAEFFSVPSSALVHGGGLSLDQLALVEPLAIAAHGIKRAAVKPGEFVLVMGAGPIGLATMAFARIAGATVIALDVNERRLKFGLEKLWIDFALNATDPDLLEKIGAITAGDMPTVVIDASGNQKAIIDAFAFMAHTARFVLVGLQKGDILFSHPDFHKREASFMSSRNATRQDFEEVMEMIRAGQIDPRNFITHSLHFKEVQQAFPTLFQTGDVIKALISFKD